ncbi:hypothetical protein Y032_0357g3379 [Ancylostoma ceylanicum]|uniref:Uncharacterized protein n=1 Tax=Ancylostoma ceylanicum TaxID=53326 RepID=A0A016RWW1_9BILA|nr:hypothetical protein Y032_0357g3379 [Ancylostoma ceylanicum]
MFDKPVFPRRIEVQVTANGRSSVCAFADYVPPVDARYTASHLRCVAVADVVLPWEIARQRDSRSEIRLLHETS